MSLRKITLTLVWLSCCSGIVSGQVAIRSGTVLKSSGTLATNTSINNASTTADFSATQLLLAGTNQTLASASATPIILTVLTVDGGGIKTISGNWHVTQTLALDNGIIETANGATLLYSGAGDAVGNDNSYVRGYFYTKGSGRKFFPLGGAQGYAPAALESFGGDEIGMRFVDGDAGITLPEGVIAYFTGHYWETSAVSNSPVSLSTHGSEDFLSASKPVVIQSGNSANTISLLGSVSGDFIVSDEPASNTVLIIGKMAEFKIIIHDLITPFVVGDPNDALVIENIDLTATNHVRLIDRWGVVAAEFVDYQNDSEFDFSTLSPGNYVCLVEYSYPGETATTTAKGVVTVLKSK